MLVEVPVILATVKFPISRDPPEGGTLTETFLVRALNGPFPISRDPPEGGTCGTKSRRF